MKLLEYGKADAPAVLVQPIDGRDLSGMEQELAALRRMTNADFRLIAVQVDRWNNDLSPWQAPAVFGREGFGDGAAQTLAALLPLTGDKTKRYYLGGYSLAGLFALWAAYQTNAFQGIAAVSPSVWFPGFSTYRQEQKLQCGAVYLSLGNRESKTRHPLMATVGDRIREIHHSLETDGTACVLEWNQGNHFTEPEIRTAKGFAWLLNR